MAAPTVNECRFPVDVVYTWVDGNDPEWDAAREARIAGDGGHRPDPGGQRPGAVHLARRAALLAPQSCTCSRRGSATSTSSPSGQVPDWLDARPPRRRRSSTTRRDPAGRRAADVQLARDRDLAAPHPRAGRALRLLQRRLLPRPAAAARGAVQPGRAVVGVLLAEHHRAHGPARLGAVPQGRVEQPPRCCRTRSARSRPTRWPTRRTPTAPRCCARSSSGSPTWSARPTRSPFRSDTDISTLSSLRPALRAADRDGVRRRGRHRVRQHHQPRPRLAALAAARTASRTSSASATTTTTASARAASTSCWPRSCASTSRSRRRGRRTR